MAPANVKVEERKGEMESWALSVLLPLRKLPPDTFAVEKPGLHLITHRTRCQRDVESQEVGAVNLPSLTWSAQPQAGGSGRMEKARAPRGRLEAAPEGARAEARPALQEGQGAAWRVGRTTLSDLPMMSLFAPPRTYPSPSRPCW